MPEFKNVSPRGDLELVLHAQEDDDGVKVTQQRIIFTTVGETFTVSEKEAALLAGQEYNFERVTKAQKKGETA